MIISQIGDCKTEFLGCYVIDGSLCARWCAGGGDNDNMLRNCGATCNTAAVGSLVPMLPILSADPAILGTVAGASNLEFTTG